MNIRDTIAVSRDSRRIIVSLATANAALVILAVVLLTKISGNETIVRMVPPIPSHEEMVVGSETFNAAYAENWGLWLATLVGNLNPENIDTTIGMISRIMAPDVYEKVRPSLLESASNMKIQGFSLRFEPTNINYDPKSQITYVTGRMTEIPVRGKPTTEYYTYETRFSLRNGIPSLRHFRAYSGEPSQR